MFFAVTLHYRPIPREKFSSINFSTKSIFTISTFTDHLEFRSLYFSLFWRMRKKVTVTWTLFRNETSTPCARHAGTVHYESLLPAILRQKWMTYIYISIYVCLCRMMNCWAKEQERQTDFHLLIELETVSCLLCRQSISWQGFSTVGIWEEFLGKRVGIGEILGKFFEGFWKVLQWWEKILEV